MFAIAPQSVTIIVPGEDAPMPTLVFRNDGDDVAKSVLEVTSPEGHKHILTFNTRGQLVDQQFVEYTEPEPAPPSNDAFVSQPDPIEGDPRFTTPKENPGGEEVKAVEEPPHQASPGSEKQPA